MLKAVDEDERLMETVERLKSMREFSDVRISPLLVVSTTGGRTVSLPASLRNGSSNRLKFGRSGTSVINEVTCAAKSARAASPASSC